jgi:hypothetical protein
MSPRLVDKIFAVLRRKRNNRDCQAFEEEARRPVYTARSAAVGRLQNKIALVTDAGAGIGRAPAKLFAADGGS